MKTIDKKANTDFNSVKFMRQVRDEMSKEFIKDKKKYLLNLEKAMKDFKSRQKKVHKNFKFDSISK